MGFGLAVSAGEVRSRDGSKEGPVIIQLKMLGCQKLSVLMRFTTASTAADRPKRSELPYDDTLLLTYLSTILRSTGGTRMTHAPGYTTSLLLIRVGL